MQGLASVYRTFKSTRCASSAMAMRGKTCIVDQVEEFAVPVVPDMSDDVFAFLAFLRVQLYVSEDRLRARGAVQVDTSDNMLVK
jgi:hypothetical protein